MKDNFQFSIFNFQLFYRFLLWRDKHIKEKHRQFSGRYLYGSSSYCPEVDHSFYTTSSDRQF